VRGGTEFTSSFSLYDSYMKAIFYRKAVTNAASGNSNHCSGDTSGSRASAPDSIEAPAQPQGAGAA
jgi:hypothetical protein